MNILYGVSKGVGLSENQSTRFLVIVLKRECQLYAFHTMHCMQDSKGCETRGTPKLRWIDQRPPI